MSQKKEVTINNPYTDWQEAFDQIPNKDQMTIIELGCGEGTQYLLDNFKKVISIEYSRYPYDFTVTSPKHTFVKFEASQKTIKKDDVLIETRGETRPDFTEEVDMLMDEIMKYKADIIFVDFGFHFRGEVVKTLVKWDKIKIIAFHDTNFPYYGYPKVDTKYEYKDGQGTVVWDLNPSRTPLGVK
jgi:16S rRNA A1518/A1519 N6-dimethyltransferase RsmA/KsgA/DIM1 with predicted DNA glycosylase/AP lyase activity